MTPTNPAKPVPSTAKSPTAPPYVDEDPNEASVQQGLDEAEDEIREAVADAYEASALASAQPDEMLDDIDYTEAEDEDEEAEAPELEAMHRESISEDDQ